MKITIVRRKQFDGGIPIQGRQNLNGVHRILLDKSPKCSYDQFKQSTIDDHFSEIFKPIIGDQTEGEKYHSSFQELLSKMDDQLNRHNIYKGFCSSVVGSSLVTVEVFDREQDIYILSLSNPYAGNRVEKGLAEAFHIERGLEKVRVDVELEPYGDLLQIDANELMQKLQEAGLEIQHLSLEEILKRLAPKEASTISGVDLTDEANGLNIHIALNGSGRHTSYQVSGSTITGPLEPDCDHSGEFFPPAILCTVRSNRRNYFIRSDSFPIIDSAGKIGALSVVKKIEEAFKPV